MKALYVFSTMQKNFLKKVNFRPSYCLLSGLMMFPKTIEKKFQMHGCVIKGYLMVKTHQIQASGPFLSKKNQTFLGWWTLTTPPPPP